MVFFFFLLRELFFSVLWHWLVFGVSEFLDCPLKIRALRWFLWEYKKEKVPFKEKESPFRPMPFMHNLLHFLFGCWENRETEKKPQSSVSSLMYSDALIYLFIYLFYWRTHLDRAKIIVCNSIGWGLFSPLGPNLWKTISFLSPHFLTNQTAVLFSSFFLELSLLYFG